MQKQLKYELFPSLLCGNLYNIESSVTKLKTAGYNTMHVDILDGHFSPSMPLGIDSVVQMKKTSEDINLDVHIMSTKNDFFVDELLKVECAQMCFHYETTEHVDYLVRKIKKTGTKVGIALKPSTPINVLEEIVDSLDYVLLMLINPGFAGDKSEKQIPYAADKIKRCRQFLDLRNCDIPIEVDGRITFSNLELLIQAGANYFVGGSGLTFAPQNSLEENLVKFREIVNCY